MIRRSLTALLRLTLRVFFRRIEVAGLERVPRRAGLIFVLNHPNALVDPAFLLCHAPRRVSFLAKSTLFRMPVVGALARAMEAIPVYRRQDEDVDTSRNRETFARAHELLRSGGAIAICPEGVSHNEPSLRPVKTGAARIALGAASTGAGALDLWIVPAGLYYTAKTAFRSSALIYFGEPLSVPLVPVGPDGEPPREAVRELSARIEAALRDATLNAEHTEALATIARAERIFSSDATTPGGLERELKLRRRFIEGYSFHRAHSPERLIALEARIRRYEEELRQINLDPHDLSPRAIGRGADAFRLVGRALLFTLLAPLALAGALANYPAYRLTGLIATRLSRQYDDMVSTIKMIASLLLFPLAWIALAVLCRALAGTWWAAAAALLLAPLMGYLAVRFFEEFDRLLGALRALAFYVTERHFFGRLVAERAAIRRELIELGDEAARAGALKTAV